MNHYSPSRRALLIGLGAAGLGVSYTRAALSAMRRRSLDLSDLEAGLGEHARIGVAALDLSTGQHLSHRADERFAMCSTFKWALAATILAEADMGALSMADEVAFSGEDMVPYSWRTQHYLDDGAMSLGALCEAAVVASDNTAANLLLRRIGGPQGFTARLREWGDSVTRLDRWEPEMNENAPGDPRDTTSPSAMAGLLARVLFPHDGGPHDSRETCLSPASRETLRTWMIAAETGHQRLRAGFPANWESGDKTGTSLNGAVNDVGFTMAPGHRAMIVACYINAPDAPGDAADAAHEEIARRVVLEFPMD